MHTGHRLKEASDLHQFLRAAEDELAWAREAEALLSNEDIGSDLQGVRFLLKKHQVFQLMILSVYLYTDTIFICKM